MSVSDRPRLAPGATMALVRVAMVIGTLAFGGIVWLLYRNGGTRADVTPARLRAYRDAAMIVWIVASIALGALALARQRVLDDARERTYTVLSWAVGELVAVAGAIFYLLSARPRFYTLGLLFFVVALLVSPLRRTD